MKITVNKQNLHHIVNVVATVITSKAHVPALSAVFLAMKDGTLAAAATDITTFAVAHCKAEGDDGAFGVPAGLLLSRLSTFTGEDVEIEVDQRATFKCGSARATLSIIPSTEFPPTNDVVGIPFTINAQELHDNLARVFPSASDDDKVDRPILQSVLFEFSEDGLTLFGTDGKQIAFTVLPADGEGRHLVPRKFVGYMLKLLDGCEGDVSITFAENAVSVEAEYWAISGVLLAGQYPNWRGVLPEGGDPVMANREALSNALRACLPFGEEARFTRIEIEGEKDLLRFKSGAGNECQEEIEAKCQPFALAIEGRRLLSLLGALKAPLVTLEIQNKPEQPRIVVMREDNFTGVINPLR